MEAVVAEQDNGRKGVAMSREFEGFQGNEPAGGYWQRYYECNVSE